MRQLSRVPLGNAYHGNNKELGGREMEAYLPYIIPAVFTFIAGLALKFIEPRGKLIYWSPNSFSTDLISSTGEKIPTLTATLYISNIGKKSIENIEIAYKHKPGHFVLNPPIPYTESTMSTGEYLIKIDSLAQKEQFAINFIEVDAYTPIIFIRAKDIGHAKHVLVKPAFIIPRWRERFNALTWSLGLFSWFYILMQIIVNYLHW
jgi:hypothetical protein